MAQQGTCSTTSSRVSSIYALLPCEVAIQLSGSVRQRIRNSISWRSLSMRSGSTSSNTSDESSSTTIVNTGASTPQLSRQASSADQLSTRTLTRRMEALSASPSNMPSEQDEATAIDWPAVAVGVNLSQAALNGRGSMDTAVARAMLVDGLKYMVGALPDDLSEREVDLLKEFLPAWPLPASSVEVHGPRRTSMNANTHPQNVLRSSTARLVCFLISLFVLAVPIFASLMSRALEYERQHHLAERTLQGSGQLARAAGTASVSAGDRLVRLGQTPVGGQCLLSARWVIQSIVEGITDGVDQTLKQQRPGMSLDRPKLLL